MFKLTITRSWQFPGILKNYFTKFRTQIWVHLLYRQRLQFSNKNHIVFFFFFMGQRKKPKNRLDIII